MDVNEFEKLVSKANIVLLGKYMLKYFGILSYGVKKKLYTSENIPLGINRYALAWTDGKTISFVARDGVILEEINFDIIHEISHIILNHVKRRGLRDNELWNIACDHVVNRNIMMIALKLEENRKHEAFRDDLIITDIKGKIGNKIYVPEDIVFLEDVHKQFPKATAEEVYYLLEQEEKNAKKNIRKSPKSTNKKNQKETLPGSGGGRCKDKKNTEKGGEGKGVPFSSPAYCPSDGGQSGGDDGGGGEENTNQLVKGGNSRFLRDVKTIKVQEKEKEKEVQIITVKDIKTNQTYQFSLDCTVDPNVDMSKCDEIKNRARSLWHSKTNTFSKGSFPGSLVSYLDETFKIEIPWQSLCESAILYPVQASRGRTWSYPNFYFRRHAKVPGKRMRSLQKKLFVVAIDSSGSISDYNLKVFISIILNSIKHFDGLVVLVHDVDVQQEFYFEKKPNEQKVFDSIREIKGRGGTSHGPVFKKIQQIIDENNLVSIVMSLTDYQSDVQHIYKSFNWIANTPMIWAITTKLKVDLPGTEFTQICIPPDISAIGKLK